MKWLAITDLSVHFGVSVKEMREFLLEKGFLIHVVLSWNPFTGKPGNTTYTPSDWASNKSPKIVRRRPGTNPGGARGTWEWNLPYMTACWANQTAQISPKERS